MADYKQMYYHLFNRVTDIIEQLKDVQRETEEIFTQTDNETESAKTISDNAQVPPKTRCFSVNKENI